MKYFTKFDPLKNQRVEIMNEKGVITAPNLMPNLSKEKILSAYKLMCLSRMQDDWQNKFQRQGRLLSFLTSTGQEACEVAYGMQVTPNKDWFIPAYRNNAALLAAGMPMRNIMLYWAGNEKGAITPANLKVMPFNVTIGTQYSHAAGVAFAEKYMKRSGVVFTTIGDGGSSEGEFYEAMNFAKLHEVPAIFCLENNKYAISTPSKRATKAINFAVKSIACGLPGIKVDGNDFFACYAVIEEAVAAARAGNGPFFIEFDTYRLGAHSSSDDPSIYRDPKELDNMRPFEPLVRLKAYLIANKMWTEEAQAKLDAEQEAFVKNEFKWVEENNKAEIDDAFKYTYAEMPDNLKAQLDEAKAFWAKQGGK